MNAHHPPVTLLIVSGELVPRSNAMRAFGRGTAPTVRDDWRDEDRAEIAAAVRGELDPALLPAKSVAQYATEKRKHQMATAEAAMVFLYFITTADRQFVKIGIARDPLKRMADLQVGHPTDLVLSGARAYSTRSAARAAESGLHTRLADHRSRGEWFYLTPEVRTIALGYAAPSPARIRGRVTSDIR